METKTDHPSDKFNIQLHIGKYLQRITVKRENEQLFRDAAKNINEKLSRYQENYPNMGYEKSLYITLLDFAVYALQAENNNKTAPFDEAIRKLTSEVENALGLTSGDNIPDDTNSK